jgi:protease PrsW
LILFIASAFIPALFIGLLFYVMDKNKEPFFYLLRAFVAGIISIGVLIVLIVILPDIQLVHGPDRNALIDSFYNAGFKEEVAKMIALLVAVYFSRHFDEWYDGILYGVMVGLGFAFIENIKYFYQFYDQNGWYIIVGRTILSMPLHALLGGIMGYFVGKAKFTLDDSAAPFWLFLALVVPALVHGSFNFALTILVIDLKWLSLPIVLTLWGRVLKLKKRTQKKDIF